MRRLNDYREIVGDETVERIQQKAKKFRGARVVHINSTSDGGGVAEILRSLVPLKNDLGIDAQWMVIPGPPDFFALTKRMHNGLQGACAQLTEQCQRLYLETNNLFAACTAIEADCVVVHDPQPLPLVSFCEKGQPWIWRCHVDLSQPNGVLWDYLKQFVTRYDVAVMSNEAYLKSDLPVPQMIVFPAIDPLSRKNVDLPDVEARRLVHEAGVPTDKPLITQVSRMDVWKDPEGLLDVLDHVRQTVDCRLVYCYSSSIDDPEGADVFSRTYRKAERLVQRGDVVFVEGTDPVLVNAIQRSSDVILQKSTREGFCLCITEALWKERPVVATNVGGIPIQLKEAENGFLVEPGNPAAFADKVVELLRNPGTAELMGKNGKETVRSHFLITRLLSDHLDLLDQLLGETRVPDTGARAPDGIGA